MVALAVLLGAAACSSSDPSDTAATSTSAAGGDGSTTTSVAAPTGGDGTSTTVVQPAEHGDLPTVELSDGEQAYVDALMKEQPSNMDEEQATCVASHWIQAVGVEAVEAAGVTVDDIESGTSSINDVVVDEALAEKIVDSYETCEFDLVSVVVSGFSGSTGGDPAKTACIEDVITPEVARRYMVVALTGMAQGGSPELIEIQRLVEPCLT